MRTLGAIFTVLLLCSTVISSSLPSVTLAWDIVDDPDLKGYNIYYKFHLNENYDKYHIYEILEEDLDNPLFPQITIFGLKYDTLYYFVATAFTEQAESIYSNEVQWIKEEGELFPSLPLPNENGGGCFISIISGKPK